MAIRKNIAHLTSAEKKEFIEALQELKRTGKYDEYVLIHAKAPMTKIHRGPAFLSWHRLLLLELEQDLQEISGNPDLGIPYWHWGENALMENPEEYAMWQDDFFGGNGDPEDDYMVKTGPLKDWTIVNMMGEADGRLKRSFGESPLAPTLANNHDIARVLQITPFDVAPWSSNSPSGFRNALEGWIGGRGAQMHNRGHMWVGGSMIPMTSPNDPVFFLHHCFVDKLWWDWMQLHPEEVHYMPELGAAMGQNFDDYMHKAMRGNPQNSSMLDIETLGYTYDKRESLEQLMESPVMDDGQEENGDMIGNDMSGHDMHGHDHDMSEHDMPGHNTQDHDMPGHDMSGNDTHDHDMSGNDMSEGEMEETGHSDTPLDTNSPQEEEPSNDLPDPPSSTGTSGGRSPKASGKGCMLVLGFLLILMSMAYQLIIL